MVGPTGWAERGKEKAELADTAAWGWLKAEEAEGREGVWGLVSLPGIEESIRWWELSATNASDALRHCTSTTETLLPSSRQRELFHLGFRLSLSSSVSSVPTSCVFRSAEFCRTNVCSVVYQRNDRESLGLKFRRADVGRKLG